MIYNVPKKRLWIRRKPSTSQGISAIKRVKTSLNTDEPKKLRPINNCSSTSTSISTSKSPRTRKRVEISESVLRTTATEDWNVFLSKESDNGENDSGNANKKAK